MSDGSPAKGADRPRSSRADAAVKSSTGRVNRPTCADTPADANIRSAVSLQTVAGLMPRIWMKVASVHEQSALHQRTTLAWTCRLSS